MPNLTSTLLGTTTVVWDERPLRQFRATKVQALLIYLVMNRNKVHQRDTLLDLLWPGSPQDLAQSSLRQTLYRLRQAIPECATQDSETTVPFLLADRQTVQVNPAAVYDLDVDTFTRLLVESEVGDAAQQKQCLSTAVALYQGDFLADFYLPDSAVFEEWAAAVRGQLRRQMLAALTRLADIYMSEGAFAEAETCVRRHLAMDNLQESAHRQLMAVLARSGRRPAALSHYESCRRLLQEELGIEPSAETQALYEAIRAGQLDRKAAGAGEQGSRGEVIHLLTPSPPHPLTPTLPHNLPAPATLFIGRQMELNLLDEWLAQPGTRLITLTGPGGMGKTRLALACAAQQLTAITDNAARFADGVFFVPLAGLDTVVHIIPAVAEALNFPLQGPSAQEARSPQQQLLDYLCQKQMLIVLDNFEQLLEGAGILTEILPAAPQVQLIVTSRDKLGLHDEQLFPLDGLGFPDPLPEADMSVETAATYTAVQLFLQAGRRVQPTLALTPENLPTILRLCRQLSGIPLALELAASWLDTLALTAIAGEIQQNLDLLAADWQDMPARHRTFRAAMDTSWQRLAASEQAVFAQLSVFRGGFTLAAAQAVVALPDEKLPIPRLLARLVNKSFLSFDAQENRYHSHELLRQYAGEKVAGEQAGARERHARYFAEFLCRREPGLKGAEEEETLALLEADSNNIWEGWLWLVAQGQADLLLPAADSMGLFYELRGRHPEGYEAFAAVIQSEAMSQAADSLAGQRLRVRALAWAMVFSAETAVLAEQLGHYLAHLPDLPETIPERAFGLLQQGRALHWSDTAQARQLYSQALAHYRHINDAWGMAMALYELGWLHFWHGHYDKGQAYFSEALAVNEASGSVRGMVWTNRGLVGCALLSGDFATAATKVEQITALLSRSAMPLLHAEGLAVIAAVHDMNGRYDLAAPYYDQLIHINQKLGRFMVVAGHSLERAGMHLHLGQYGPAEQMVERARVIWENHARLGICYHYQGMIALAYEDYRGALAYLEQALTIHQGINSPGDEAGALALLALAHCGLLDAAAAGPLLHHSRQLIVQTRGFIPLMENLLASARLLVLQGQAEIAVELYALAMRHPSVANSRLYDDIAGRYIRQRTTHLPPDVYQTAWQQGQARDLWQTAEALLADLEAYLSS